MRRTAATITALVALAIPATALANWTGYWTGTPNLTLGPTTTTCCADVTNNYTNSTLHIPLHRTGPGYTITTTGTLNGPSWIPDAATPFLYTSTTITLTSNTTGQTLCTHGTLTAGGTWAWGTANAHAYARLDLPNCPVFNKPTIIEIDNSTLAQAIVH